MRIHKPIEVRITAPGKALVTISKRVYPQVSRHWEEQLTGANRRKWGTIYTDPSKTHAEERRADAMWQHGRAMTKGIHVNRDECPGAMFVWETQLPADVQELCATDNQQFGRDLYRELRTVLLPKQQKTPHAFKGRLYWWEVEFEFLP